MADDVQEICVPRVLVEIQKGEGLSLSAAGKLFPGHRVNRNVNPSTVFRWITKGVASPTGHVIKLEAVRVGARWLTSWGAVNRFSSALTGAPAPSPSPGSQLRSPTKLHRDAERAGEELKKRGA